MKMLVYFKALLSVIARWRKSPMSIQMDAQKEAQAYLRKSNIVSPEDRENALKILCDVYLA